VLEFSDVLFLYWLLVRSCCICSHKILYQLFQRLRGARQNENEYSHFPLHVASQLFCSLQLFEYIFIPRFVYKIKAHFLAQRKIKALFDRRRICSIRLAMMSSDSIAFSIRSTTGRHSPTEASEVEQESKEIPPSLDYVSPPPSILISKHHSSATMGSFRLKERRCTSYDSAVYHPAVRSTNTGRRDLSNVVSFETGASFPTTLDLRHVPKNEFILATPNQLSMEIQHPVVKRPRAVSMFRNESTSTESQVNSNDAILTENSRLTSLSGMFRPVQEDALEGDNTVVTGSVRIGTVSKLRLLPRSRK
jgi:hypothetical protein